MTRRERVLAVLGGLACLAGMLVAAGVFPWP